MTLFDTNIFIYLYAHHQTAMEAFEKHEEKAMSAVTLVELYDGAFRETEEERQWVDELSRYVDILPIEEAVSKVAGRLMADERLKGKRNPLFSGDLLIAATAIAHNIPLLTANEKDFKKYKGLKVLSLKS